LARAMSELPNITGVDFASLPTQDLERAVAFYRDTLGLAISVHMPDRGFAEFETGNLTLSVHESERMGLKFAPNPAALALHVPDLAAARADLESKGVVFHIPTIDTGVCHIAPFNDPDGNGLMLHHRYAPRIAEHD